MAWEKRRQSGGPKVETTGKTNTDYPEPASGYKNAIINRSYEGWIPNPQMASTTTDAPSDELSQTLQSINGATADVPSSATLTERAGNDVPDVVLGAGSIIATMTGLEDIAYPKRAASSSIGLSSPVSIANLSSAAVAEARVPSSGASISIQVIVKTETLIRTEIPSSFVTVTKKCGHRGKHCSQMLITEPLATKTITATEALESDVVSEWDNCIPAAISSSIFSDVRTSSRKHRIHHGGICDIMSWACWFYGHTWTKHDHSVRTLFRPGYSTTVVDATVSGTPVHTTITCQNHAGPLWDMDHFLRVSRSIWASTHIVTAEYTRPVNAPNYTFPALEARAMETGAIEMGATPAATVPQLPMVTAEMLETVDAPDSSPNVIIPGSPNFPVDMKYSAGLLFLILFLFVTIIAFGAINASYRQRNRPVVRQQYTLVEKL